MGRIEDRLAGKVNKAQTKQVSFTATSEQVERIDSAVKTADYDNRSDFLNDAAIDAVEKVEEAQKVKAQAAAAAKMAEGKPA
jgi:Arc/MetJ-type ribon-helix-helix transcriptional regulator